MHNQFADLELKLKDKTYICDDEERSGLTVADYALGCQAMDLILLGQDFS